ncbi:DEAD/DEAH box helicase [Cellulomonas sp. JZ18]|uniref:DEAD/DEAH box helicase n=1 Tax=Cellulomonas sp. JZ18 TaxID=2654191 RepID=UPI0012D3B042|nr:DEAD/DEAH box helicase [Cellulomonas sp. JZ18]QGQ19838.1 DEAD/DEAH box helicase [Cellulomonas sp. JZ18]
MPSFSSLGLPEVLVRSLADRGVSDPFPIQAATLPDTLAGRDVLGRGRTGSGKTLAFSLPLVARLAGLVPGTRAVRRTPGRPTGLVLAPTRELASQIAATLEPLAQAAGLRVTTIFGGVSQRPQEAALKAGVDVVVACPGRLEDLMGQKVVSLADVRVTVLDEADHMADLGFLPGVRRILSATPAGGQRMLFSATLDNGVDKLVTAFLKDPLRHSVDSAASPVATMTHHVFHVDGAETKKDVVRHLASGTGRRVLFMRTKHQAKKLAKQLTATGIPAVDLHGNLSQGARERNLEAFSSGEVRVLVATDIAARGIHVDDVELVVHVDPPAEHKAYLHRSGRTARAGSGGTVATLVLPEQEHEVRTMTRQAGIQVRPQAVRAGDAVLERLVGAPMAPVVATAVPEPARQGGGRGAASSGGGARPAARRGEQSGARGVQGGASRGPAGSGATSGDGTTRDAAGGARRRRRGGRGRGTGTGAATGTAASAGQSREPGRREGGAPRGTTYSTSTPGSGPSGAVRMSMGARAGARRGR